MRYISFFLFYSLSVFHSIYILSVVQSISVLQSQTSALYGVLDLLWFVDGLNSFLDLNHGRTMGQEAAKTRTVTEPVVFSERGIGTRRRATNPSGLFR